MRARAEQPVLQGQIYWWTNKHEGFSPEWQQSFSIPSDGEWHVIRINLAATGKLFLDDTITRLRVDPADTPAEIEQSSIRISFVCTSSRGRGCVCSE
jgi:hypothetical protein